jgi:cell division protein FtsB
MLPVLKLMTMKYTFLTFLLMACCTQAFSSDETAQAKSGPNTLSQQYKSLKTDLEIIDGYRMIKMFTMDRFWTVVEDSLAGQKTKIRESAALIAQHKKEVEGLQASLNKTEKEKEGLQAGVDNIMVFGNPYSKAGFITLVSIVGAALLVLCGVLFSIGRVSLYTTRELRKLNENLYQEFDTYKRNAVEKEIKLSRELQNHKNKLAELKIA